MKADRLLRRLIAVVLPRDHRAVVLADLDADASTLQMAMSLPGALRLRLRAARHGLWDDVRQGGRLIHRHPGFALVVTLTLTLGVAAANAVTTVAYAVLLRPLPFANADRIVSIEEFDRTREATSGNVSWPDYLDYRARNTTLELVAGHTDGSRTIQLPGADATRVPVAMVTGSFFDVLGVRALVGRTISDEDVRDGAPQVVVLSHAAWRARFGGAPGIVGQMVSLDGARIAIVGVLPAEFEFPPRGLAELWLPVRPSAAQLQRKYFHWMDMIARLRPGVTVQQAEVELDSIARSFAGEDPQYHGHTGARAARLRDRLVREARPVVLVLSLAGVFVLVVASANVAGLLLSRGAVRRSEMSLRGALGAARWRQVRQLIIESLVLAVPGIGLGIVAGYWAVRGFVNAVPRGTRASLPHLAALDLDPGAIAFSLVVVLVVVTASSLVPAFRATRDARTGGRGIVGRGGAKAQWLLVGGQVALAVTLLSGAGLMVQSLRKLLDVSPGFQTSGLMTFTLSLSGPRYQSREALTQFFQSLSENVASVPGVDGVSRINRLPLTGSGYSGEFTTVGEPGRGEQSTLVRSVAPNYFDVMGIPLERGRPFGDSDIAGSPAVILINRRLADSAFNGNPLGQRVTFPFTGPDPLTIIGVVGDEQFDAVDQPVSPVVYFPDSQDPSRAMSFVVRTSLDPSTIAATIRARVAEADPSLPVSSIATMEDIAGDSEAVFRRRAVMTLLLGFAVSAVVLAAIGVYGVLAQLVADRTREIGVRMALGARASSVTAAVLGRGMVAAAIGLALGLAGSVALGRAMGALLFGTAPADTVTLLVVVGVIALAVTIAALLPTRRALRIDPMEALRREG